MSNINQKIPMTGYWEFVLEYGSHAHQRPMGSAGVKKEKPEQKIKEPTVADFQAIEKAKQKREMRRAKRLKFSLEF